MEAQLCELEAGQKKSQELILRLSKALKTANERNENLKKKINQALKLQRDSHETICGILEKKMEEIEQKHQEFIKSMGDIMAKTVEGFETSQNNLEKKMTESEDLLLNTATEVALLKISLNEHQRKILWEMKQQTMALDLTVNCTVISTEEEASPEDEEEKENHSESLDAPVSSKKNKKKMDEGNSKKKNQQKMSMKEITESVLDKVLVGGFSWARSMVSVNEDGDVLLKEGDAPPFPLVLFMEIMNSKPLRLFPHQLFEIECQSCEKNFIIRKILPDGFSTICLYCKEPTIVSALPQPDKTYLICQCNHAQLIGINDPTPPCKFCKLAMYFDAEEDNLVKIPKPAAQTLEKFVERLLNIDHLEWVKPHVSLVDDENLRVKCCTHGTCSKEAVMDFEAFHKYLLVLTWVIVPSEFEIDCWNCKQTMSLHEMNIDKLSKKCPNCNETTVIVTGNENDKPWKLLLFSCGHYRSIQTKEEKTICLLCKCTKVKREVPSTKIRVPWRKGQSKEVTWPVLIKP